MASPRVHLQCSILVYARGLRAPWRVRTDAGRGRNRAPAHSPWHARLAVSPFWLILASV